MAKIIIFDTTLRDGESALGFALNSEERVRLANQLISVGVDVVEAGYPASGEAEARAVSRIAKNAKGTIICALAGTELKEVEAAGKALKEAEESRIHVYLDEKSTSSAGRKGRPVKKALQKAEKGIAFAKGFTEDIEFSATEAVELDRRFLFDLYSAAISAGATTINVADTFGRTLPEEFGNLLDDIMENVERSSEVIWSVHCHNGLGMATANSLTALSHGVTQIECTVNGIGANGGNAPLEEIVRAINLRGDFMGHTLNIKPGEIYLAGNLMTDLR